MLLRYLETSVSYRYQILVSRFQYHWFAGQRRWGCRNQRVNDDGNGTETWLPAMSVTRATMLCAPLGIAKSGVIAHSPSTPAVVWPKTVVPLSTSSTNAVGSVVPWNVGVLSLVMLSSSKDPDPWPRSCRAACSPIRRCQSAPAEKASTRCCPKDRLPGRQFDAHHPPTDTTTSATNYRYLESKNQRTSPH